MGSEEELIAVQAKKEKKEKKSKKEKKRKRENEEKDSKKEERKRLKAQKKAEKEELLSKVPKVDEYGIAYTKMQIKRMIKRISRGLDPVETEQERRERLRERKREEKETKDELAGMIFKQETKNEEESGDEENDVEDENNQEHLSDNDDNQESDTEEENVEEDNDAEDENGKSVCAQVPPKNKKPRSKPVPSDYVCYACKNKHTPAHWIYDCPDKKHQPGYREVKKSQRGMNEPSTRKVFVTGIPFDAKTNEVKAYFEKEMKCGKVTNCKLFLFSDTKRCKGNGIVTFQSDEGARKALKLDGTEFDLNTDDDKKGKKNKKSKPTLWLGVKKMRNRAQTKQN